MKSNVRSLAVLLVLATPFLAPSALAQSVAIAHCRATGKVGIGQGATVESAIGQSVQNCIASGGERFCCQAEATAEPGQQCIAVADDPTNDFYPIVGYGQDANQAGNDAIIRCGVQCRALAQVCPE